MQHGAGDQHPLAHPARELVRVAPRGIAGRGDPDPVEHRERTLARFRSAHAVHERRLLEVRTDRHRRIHGEEWFLEHHCDASAAERPKFARGLLVHWLIAELDPRFGRERESARQEAEQRPAQRALSRAGGADEADAGAAVQRERNTVEDRRDVYSAGDAHPERVDAQRDAGRDAGRDARRGAGRDVGRDTHRGRSSVRAIRSASTFAASTLTVIASTGKSTSHQCRSGRDSASRMMFPQLAIGGRTPMPR